MVRVIYFDIMVDCKKIRRSKRKLWRKSILNYRVFLFFVLREGNWYKCEDMFLYVNGD